MTNPPARSPPTTTPCSPPQPKISPQPSRTGLSDGAREIPTLTAAKVYYPHPGFKNYHNQSSIVFGTGKAWKEEPAPTKTSDMRKKKEAPIDNRPVWNYNPKNAGKTTMVLGDEKTDYRKKDEVYKQRTPTTLTNSRKAAKK